MKKSVLIFLGCIFFTTFGNQVDSIMCQADCRLIEIVIDQFLKEGCPDKQLAADCQSLKHHLVEQPDTDRDRLSIEILPHLIHWLRQRAPRQNVQEPNQAIAGCANACTGSGGSADLKSLDELLVQLRACCAQIDLDFQGTFTLLQNGFNGTFTTMAAIVGGSCDFSSVLTALRACCSNTFTALAAINTSVDTSGIYTVIADLSNTLTGCCDSVNREIFTTFTVIEEIENKAILAVDFAGIFTVVQTCCQSTFSIIQDIKNSISTQECTPITIITAPLTITAPGFYCLANDIVGDITINSSEVTLYLNNKTIRPIATAIRIASNNRDIEIVNGIIDLPTGTRGIPDGDAGGPTNAISIANVTMNNQQNASIDCVAQQVTKLTLSDCLFTQGSVVGAVLISSCTNVTMENCLLRDITVTGSTLLLAENSDIIFINKSDLFANREASFCISFNRVQNSIINECRICENTFFRANATFYMINIDTSSLIKIQKCIISGNDHLFPTLFQMAVIYATGFFDGSDGITIKNCIINKNGTQANAGGNRRVYGIRFESNLGNSNSLIDSNQVYDNFSPSGPCEGISIDTITLNTNVIVRNIAYNNINGMMNITNFASNHLPHIITYSISLNDVVATPTTISLFHNLSVVA